MWDLCMAPDDTLYIGACVEHTGGMTAVLCSYHRSDDRVKYLADMAGVTGESPDSGHATQGKIHFTLNHNPNDGCIYGATHCTTAPKGEKTWSPFTMYRDPVREYPGGHLFVHNPKTCETRGLGILIPYEGIRVMVLDPVRNLLHGTTYPKNHYFIYDLARKKLEDVGRIGSVHQLALMIDQEGNGFTTDSFGRILRCDAGTHRLSMTGAQLPHAPFRRGEGNYLLQAVRQPGTDIFYGATYCVDAHLFRYDLKTNEMTDLGLPYGFAYKPNVLAHTYAGGMTFGKDGYLYYTIGEQKPEMNDGHIIRYDTRTRMAEDLGILGEGPLKFYGNSCHAKTDSQGNIYIAPNGGIPLRFFIYHPEKKE